MIQLDEFKGVVYTYKYEYDEDETQKILFNATQLLVARGSNETAALLSIMNFTIYEANILANPRHHEDPDAYFDGTVLVAKLPIPKYEFFKSILEGERGDTEKKEYITRFQHIGGVIDEVNSVSSLPVVTSLAEMEMIEPPENWQNNLDNILTSITANQANKTYENSPKHMHDGLFFRSKTEIKIYKELIERGLLVLPLPLAVLGKRNFYREPDFIIFYEGKAGILEVAGTVWHPPETAAKENDRRRMFQKLGVDVYETFDANKCYNQTKKVVDEFLEVMKRAAK